MPRVHKPKVFIVEGIGEVEDYGRDIADGIPWWLREALYSKAGTKDLPGRNKPLAPRKPAGGRAKGNAAKGRVKARKMADKG
jgi:hypothetical protein